MRLAALGAGRSDDVGSTPPISHPCPSSRFTDDAKQQTGLCSRCSGSSGADAACYLPNWLMMGLLIL